MGVIRLGLLSTARINDLLLRGARASERVRVVAVASRDPTRARAYAAARGIARAHGSYEALLADPEVDAVYVSLPNALHHEWTMRALEAGKHVLCEKPYSRYPTEVEEAFAAAERAGLVLSEAFMWRHHPQTARLVELLPSIGVVETVRATFSFVLPRRPSRDIRLRPELGGGSLMDVGCYCVSGARLLAGEEPQRVYGEYVLGPTGVDLRFSGLLRFPSGLVAELTSAFTTDHMSLEAIATDGTLLVGDPWHARHPVIVRNGVEEIRLAPADSYRLELENVADAIEGRAPILLGRDDALGQARAIDALYRSAETGEAVLL